MAAETVEDGAGADEDEASAHEHVADEEDEDDEAADGSEDPGSRRIDGGPEALIARDGDHDVGIALAEQLVHGDDLIAARVQALDDHGQGLDGVGAVSAAIVQQDDGAVGSWSMTDWVICSGVGRGFSCQSSGSILSPTVV
jgi:hypothetical protein